LISAEQRYSPTNTLSAFLTLPATTTFLPLPHGPAVTSVLRLFDRTRNLNIFRAPMRTLIRHKQTKMFYAPDGTWTKDPWKALRLESSAKAVQMCREGTIAHAEVFYAFEDPRYNFAIEVC
jgi:hypothetical protein